MDAELDGYPNYATAAAAGRLEARQTIADMNTEATYVQTVWHLGTDPTIISG